MGKLSNREKILIYILIVFALVVGGTCLVVMPTLDKVSTLNEKYDALTAERDEKEAAIAQIDIYNKQIADAQVDVAQKGGEFYSKLSAEDIDSLFQNMLDQYNLRCTKITFGDASYRGVPSLSEQLVLNTEEKDGSAEEEKKTQGQTAVDGASAQSGDAGDASTEESSDENGEEEESYSAYLFANDVTVNGLGNLDDVEAFAASFASNLSIKLVDFQWKQGDTVTEFSAVFEIYMFDPSAN